jgi:hypothetical protein
MEIIDNIKLKTIRKYQHFFADVEGLRGGAAKELAPNQLTRSRRARAVRLPPIECILYLDNVSSKTLKLHLGVLADHHFLHAPPFQINVKEWP